MYGDGRFSRGLSAGGTVHRADSLPKVHRREHPAQAVEVDTAVGEEDAVGRTVQPPGERGGIDSGVGSHSRCRAEDIVAEGCALEDEIVELIVDELRRRVVVRFYLVADDLHLLCYLLLGIGAVENDVGEHVDSLRQTVLEDCGIVHRVGFRGVGVEISADALEGLDDIYRRPTARTLEASCARRNGPVPRGHCPHRPTLPLSHSRSRPLVMMTAGE